MLCVGSVTVAVQTVEPPRVTEVAVHDVLVVVDCVTESENVPLLDR